MSLANREKYFWFKPRNKIMHKVYHNVDSKKTCGKENCNCKCNKKDKEKDKQEWRHQEHTAFLWI